MPVLVLLKLTTNGAQPAESEMMKSATGACPKSFELVSNKSITHALTINSDVFSVTDPLYASKRVQHSLEERERRDCLG